MVADTNDGPKVVLNVHNAFAPPLKGFVAGNPDTIYPFYAAMHEGEGGFRNGQSEGKPEHMEHEDPLDGVSKTREDDIAMLRRHQGIESNIGETKTKPLATVTAVPYGADLDSSNVKCLSTECAICRLEGSLDRDTSSAATEQTLGAKEPLTFSETRKFRGDLQESNITRGLRAELARFDVGGSMCERLGQGPPTESGLLGHATSPAYGSPYSTTGDIEETRRAFAQASVSDDEQESPASDQSPNVFSMSPVDGGLNDYIAAYHKRYSDKAPNDMPRHSNEYHSPRLTKVVEKTSRFDSGPDHFVSSSKSIGISSAGNRTAKTLKDLDMLAERLQETWRRARSSRKQNIATGSSFQAPLLDYGLPVTNSSDETPHASITHVKSEGNSEKSQANKSEDAVPAQGPSASMDASAIAEFIDTGANDADMTGKHETNFKESKIFCDTEGPPQVACASVDEGRKGARGKTTYSSNCSAEVRDLWMNFFGASAEDFFGIDGGTGLGKQCFAKLAIHGSPSSKMKFIDPIAHKGGSARVEALTELRDSCLELDRSVANLKAVTDKMKEEVLKKAAMQQQTSPTSSPRKVRFEVPTQTFTFKYNSDHVLRAKEEERQMLQARGSSFVNENVTPTAAASKPFGDFAKSKHAYVEDEADADFEFIDADDVCKM